MKQKMFLTAAAALVLLFLSAAPTRAAEITIDWRQKLDSGQVNDLKFMPGQEQFIIGTGIDVQVRSCEDGSKVIVYPFGAWRIEFTPDNNRIVSILPINGYKTLQLHNVNDMNLINEYALPEDEDGYGFSFSDIAVDPVRPYIYALWQKTKGIHSTLEDYRKILIYDRENLQPIGELTTEADSSLKFSEIAVSKDGKYLAAMNYGVSKLVVWSLDTRQKIVDKYISDQNSDKFSEPADIKFSKLNTDIIFFTGKFYQGFGNNIPLAGLCLFSINENRIIDSTFAILPNQLGTNPEIALFENETKVIGVSSGRLRVLDLFNKRIEFTREVTPKNELAVGSINYNEQLKYFIGGSYLIDRFTYQPNTSVPLETPKEIIYPNPTSGFVNIPLNCINSSKYEIFSSNGKLIKSSILPGVSGNLLTIDFTQYPAGVYSVKLYCGKEVEQYQVVRGE